MFVVSFLLPAVEKEWNLEPFWEAMVGGVVFAGIFLCHIIKVSKGMLVGAPGWGILSDKFGRKVGFILSVIITGVFGLLSGFAPSLPYLLVCRCLVGFGLSGRLSMLQFLT